MKQFCFDNPYTTNLLDYKLKKISKHAKKKACGNFMVKSIATLLQFVGDNVRIICLFVLYN